MSREAMETSSSRISMSASWAMSDDVTRPGPVF